MSAEAPIWERLERVRDTIAAAARRSGRPPEDVTLVGVSKRQPAELVAEAARAGLDHFGENYAQEAAEKLPKVEDLLGRSPSISLKWHFIGQLQTNKVKLVAPHFQWVESLDRVSLGRALERHAIAAGNPLQVLLQANVSREEQKGGADPERLEGLLAASTHWPHLQVVGLMTIPAAAQDPLQTRPAFARLRELRDKLRDAPGGSALVHLSMGMSADYEVAIEEGATIVRVGTAIFGRRD